MEPATILLDDETVSRVCDLAAQAVANPIPAADMERIAAKEISTADLRPGYATHVDYGFIVAFTIEDHPQPSGAPMRFRHASISHETFHRPPIGSIMPILGMLGYVTPITDLATAGLVWFENLAGGREAVNVVEPIGIVQ